jgi:hypothetical protein
MGLEFIGGSRSHGGLRWEPWNHPWMDGSCTCLLWPPQSNTPSILLRSTIFRATKYSLVGMYALSKLTSATESTNNGYRAVPRPAHPRLLLRRRGWKLWQGAASNVTLYRSVPSPCPTLRVSSSSPLGLVATSQRPRHTSSPTCQSVSPASEKSQSIHSRYIDCTCD